MAASLRESFSSLKYDDSVSLALSHTSRYNNAGGLRKNHHPGEMRQASLLGIAGVGGRTLSVSRAESEACLGYPEARK